MRGYMAVVGDMYRLANLWYYSTPPCIWCVVLPCSRNIHGTLLQHVLDVVTCVLRGVRAGTLLLVLDPYTRAFIKEMDVVHRYRHLLDRDLLHYCSAIGDTAPIIASLG
jgi:hypothetical protein